MMGEARNILARTIQFGIGTGALAWLVTGSAGFGFVVFLVAASTGVVFALGAVGDAFDRMSYQRNEEE